MCAAVCGNAGDQGKVRLGAAARRLSRKAKARIFFLRASSEIRPGIHEELEINRPLDRIASSWIKDLESKHRGIITRTAESVFGALLYLTEKYGRVFPSLEGLAHLSMCCKQSVVTALADLERLGFVTRIRRIRQVQTPLGFITRQITNAYRVHEPASGLGLLATLVLGQGRGYARCLGCVLINRDCSAI